jgi:hypothetical protein
VKNNHSLRPNAGFAGDGEDVIGETEHDTIAAGDLLD